LLAVIADDWDERLPRRLIAVGRRAILRGHSDKMLSEAIDCDIGKPRLSRGFK
jgi:hypothetical protein